MSGDERKPRILVVEDEAMVGLLIEDMVRDSGGEIVGPVATFEDALDLARNAVFDIAVLDLNLNGTLSYPIADVVRGRRIPIIFSTGYGSEGLREGFRDLPVLHKPFSQGDFAQAISAACAMSRFAKTQRVFTEVDRTSNG
ncbi:response regulator (plasmid) [Microvirga terrae]|uniref:Response regulator n=1 Tax=Microvirga terrae TaxID=2740529 RepID=A0ABY5RZT8_9HYPH|nr:response regulator [Microvirga terrae]UVF22543.1 response regulator [Microvirga terrae]